MTIAKSSELCLRQGRETVNGIAKVVTRKIQSLERGGIRENLEVRMQEVRSPTRLKP